MLYAIAFTLKSVIHAEYSKCDKTDKHKEEINSKVFCGSIQMLGVFVLLLWKCHWGFDRDCIKSIDCFG